ARRQGHHLARLVNEARRRSYGKKEMLQALQFMLALFQRQPRGNQLLDPVAQVAGLLLPLQLSQKITEPVPLAPPEFSHLFDPSLFPHHGPLFGDRDIETFTQDFEIPKLVESEGAAGDDLVVLQWLYPRLVNFPIGRLRP